MSHANQQQNPDGSWSQAKPIRGYGWYGIEQRYFRCKHCWHWEWNSEDMFCCHCALSYIRLRSVVLINTICAGLVLMYLGSRLIW